MSRAKPGDLSTDCTNEGKTNAFKIDHVRQRRPEVGPQGLSGLEFDPEVVLTAVGKLSAVGQKRSGERRTRSSR